MRKYVMLAEDDEDDQMFFKDALHEINREIFLDINNNGDDLMTHLNMIDCLVPDIIFLDLNMPIKDGFTCLKEIRINDKFKNCPIIILTTSNNPEHRELAYQFGANHFISKPNNFYDLKSILADILLSDLRQSEVIEKFKFFA